MTVDTTVAQGHHLPNRCQAAARSNQGAQPPCPPAQAAQSDPRIAKDAAMMAGRYAHAKQLHVHRRQLRILRRQSSGGIGRNMSPASQSCRRHSNGRWRAPPRSVRSSSASAAGSCIPSMLPRSNASARARPARPMSSASRSRSPPTPGAWRPVRAARQGAAQQPVRRHAARLPLSTERLTGREIERAYVDKGYRGHDAAPTRIASSSPGRSAAYSAPSKAELRRRDFEPVIGHMKGPRANPRPRHWKRRRRRQRHPHRGRPQPPTCSSPDFRLILAALRSDLAANPELKLAS